MGRWLAAVVVVATALTLSPLMVAPASAVTPVWTHTPLPMAQYGDHLVDEDRGLMYLTGGTGDSRVFVLDADGEVVRVVTDLPGATDLFLSPDGSRLFVGLAGAAAIAEVDPTTWEVVHRWSVAPTASDVGEIAYVDGSVWFSDGAYWPSVFALDLATNEVTKVVPLLDEPTLAVDQSRGHVIVSGYLDRTVRVIDARTHLTVDQRSLEFEVARMVVDGDQLLVSVWGGGGLVVRLGLEHLDLIRTHRLAPSASAPGVSMTPHVAAAPHGNGETVLVSDLDTGGLLTELVFPDEPKPDVLDTAFLGGRLLVIATVGGWLRVYPVDDPSVGSADISLSVSDSALVGRPSSVEGLLTYQGSGIPGAAVVITGPDGETAEAVTEPDGSFRASIVPSRSGMYSATYAGGDAHPPAWTQRWATIRLAPAVLTAQGPAQTQPGEAVVHSGTLTWDDRPLAGERVHVRPTCGPETETTTDEEGRWTVAHAPPRCLRTDYTFTFSGNAVAGGDSVHLSTVTSWHTSSLDLSPTWTEVLVDESVDLTATVSVDDRPSPNRQVSLTVVRLEDGARVLTRDTVTDADGRATTTFVPSTHGWYSVRAEFAGDDTTFAAETSGDVWVRRADTSLLVTGPQETPAQGPVVLQGRLSGAHDLPLSGRAVSVSRRADGAFVPLATVETDADGRFIFEDPSPDPYGTSYRATFAGDRLLDLESTVVDVVRRPVEARVELDIPDSASAGDIVRVTGRLFGAQDGMPVQRRRVLLSASSDSVTPETFTRALTTDMNGTFSVEIPMDVAATWTVEATYTPEDPTIPRTTTEARVAVLGHPGRLDVARRLGPDVPRDQVVLDGLLRNRSNWTPVPLTDVHVRRTSPTGAHVELDPVRTAADGTFTFRDTPPASGSWTYRFTSLPRTVEMQVNEVTVVVEPPVPSAVVTEALRPDRVARGYAVYRPAADPMIRSTTTPAGAGRCVMFQMQRWRNDSWRAVDRTGCVSTSDAGVADHRLAGRHPDGSRWRVRAVVAETPAATAATGTWTYVRFEKP